VRVIVIQGDSRSLKLVAVESPHAIFHESSIVIMCSEVVAGLIFGRRTRPDPLKC